MDGGNGATIKMVVVADFMMKWARSWKTTVSFSLNSFLSMEAGMEIVEERPSLTELSTVVCCE
jgi:hypothetical protein